MAYGFNTKHDIERVVRSVLASERTTLNDRTRPGSYGVAAPACAYIAQSSTAGIAASTGNSPTSGTVKFYGISTGGTLTEISTGETVYNFSRQRVGGSSFFLASREYGSHNYVANPGAGYDRIYGLATGAFDDEDGTITINNVKVLRGANPLDDPESTSETVLVNNVTGFASDSGALVKAEWNETLGQWEIYDAPCPEE